MIKMNLMTFLMNLNLLIKTLMNLISKLEMKDSWQKVHLGELRKEMLTRGEMKLLNKCEYNINKCLRVGPGKKHNLILRCTTY